MDRVIKITSCAMCHHEMIGFCYKDDTRFGVSEHVIKETIHPDCPLEKLK